MLFLAIVLIFALGYVLYGRILEKVLDVKDDEPVPSKTNYDGVDYVPTNKFVLLGHHFSSIAGAGPIVGPITASLAFGWVPALFWIVLGTIFIGGVHDFSSLIISIRHEGRSIAEIARKYVNKSTYKVFLAFIWLSLMYVIAVFADIAGETFTVQPQVAAISILYMVVAILFGITTYRLRLPLAFTTIFWLLVILGGIVYSLNHPFLSLGKNVWVWILIVYCLFASVLPVWFLLQPRDYLSSFLLYSTVIFGVIGLLFGKYTYSLEAFKGLKDSNLGPIFPFLFITIACGAISGFHSLVASGTTSKQLDRAKNGRFVAYGGMIIEGVLAFIALSTAMIVGSKGGGNPQRVFAQGMAQFMSILRIPENIGITFGLLSISAFVLTTLDTATRISRYIFEELFEIKARNWMERVWVTVASLVLPIILLNMRATDPAGNPIPVWKVVWPLFGTSNQLLAGLVLIVIFLWVSKTGRQRKGIFLVPAIFMAFTTLFALVYTLTVRLRKGFDVISLIALLLLVLAVFVIEEVWRITKHGK